MYDKCNKDEFELFEMLAKKIWFRRNIIVQREGGGGLPSS
jgi:hypothetical protein